MKYQRELNIVAWRIRRAMKNQGIKTHADLSRMSGISRPAISKLVKHEPEHFPTLDTLLSLEETLSVNILGQLFEPGEKKESPVKRKARKDKDYRQSYKCFTCGERYPSKAEVQECYNSHKEEKKPAGAFPCDHPRCSERFGGKDDMFAHVRTEHSDWSWKTRNRAEEYHGKDSADAKFGQQERPAKPEPKKELPAEKPEGVSALQWALMKKGMIK